MKTTIALCLGIPAKEGRKKVLLIYAWNEFGEGGITAPTRGEKAMKLEAVREVLKKPYSPRENRVTTGRRTGGLRL